MGSTYFSKRYHPDGERLRHRRPKTFLTEDAAKAYAAANGLKNFEIRKKTYSDKLVIVPK